MLRLSTPTLASGFGSLAVILVAGAAVAQETKLDTIPSDLKLVGEPVFARDGTRVAYAATAGGKSHVVIDGARSPGSTFADSPVFSADGKHTVYRAGKSVSRSAEKWWIVVDGKKKQTHDWVGPPSITADGSKVAYWAAKGVKVSPAGPYEGGRYFVVFGKKKGPMVQDGDALKPPVLSPDGGRVGYTARDGRNWYVVIGKKPSRQYPLVGSPGFSPDGKRYSYPVFDNARWFLVDHRNKEGKRFDYVGTPVYGPRGKKVAHAAKDGGKWIVVVNGKRRAGEYDGVGTPVFSPDGKRVAFRANRGGTSPLGRMPGMPSAMPGMDQQIEGGKWLVVAGKKTGKEPEYDRVGDPVWRPDGKAVAYPARKDGKWVMVIGNTEGPAHDHVGPPVFSADGTTVGYGVRDDRDLKWVVSRLK